VNFSNFVLGGTKVLTAKKEIRFRTLGSVRVVVVVINPIRKLHPCQVLNNSKKRSSPRANPGETPAPQKRTIP
jgi:hypothetical protein